MELTKVGWCVMSSMTVSDGWPSRVAASSREMRSELYWVLIHIMRSSAGFMLTSLCFSYSFCCFSSLHFDYCLFLKVKRLLLQWETHAHTHAHAGHTHRHVNRLLRLQTIWMVIGRRWQQRQRRLFYVFPFNLFFILLPSAHAFLMFFLCANCRSNGFLLTCN